MRLLAILLVCFVAVASGMFRGAPRGIATINSDTGDVMFVAVPGRRFSSFDKRRYKDYSDYNK